MEHVKEYNFHIIDKNSKYEITEIENIPDNEEPLSCVMPDVSTIVYLYGYDELISPDDNEIHFQLGVKLVLHLLKGNTNLVQKPIDKNRLELAYLPIEQLDKMTPAIDLDYIDNGLPSTIYYPIQAVYINRDTWHILNPHVYRAMKQTSTDEKFPCILVSIPADDEIGASIAISGGIDGLLSARPANDDANKQLIQYIKKTYQMNREKLFGMGADAGYWLDFIDWMNNPTPADPDPDPEEASPVIMATIESDFPELDITKQATKQDIEGIQWSAWGSIARGTYSQAFHFYVDDYRFNGIENSRLNCKIAVEPNYSAGEMTPAAIIAANMWQKRSINHNWQSQGIKTIIDLNIPHNLLSLALMGVPRGWTAYANKYYKGDTDHLIKSYRLAQQHAESDDILYIVFGSEGVADLCNQYGWKFINIAWRGESNG